LVDQAVTGHDVRCRVVFQDIDGLLAEAGGRDLVVAELYAVLARGVTGDRVVCAGGLLTTKQVSRTLCVGLL
jgi:hypothetical protein